jgi:hypothetical protein
MELIWKIVTICLLAQFHCSLSYGQKMSGSVVRGTATDIHGAVIPNSLVTFTSGEQVFSVKTSSQTGDYSITLSSGEYRVSVDASHLSFQILRRSNIKVVVGPPRSLNFELSGLLPVVESYESRLSQSFDDGPIRYLPYSYEEIPKFSESGVRNALVSFGMKCETQSSLIYKSEPFSESSGAKVTFTYDFYTITADMLSFNKGDRTFVASGGVTLKYDNKNQVFKGSVKVSVEDNKLRVVQIKK